jgi:hypothetical protein
VVGAVIERIKERLRVIPKLDILSMPFRVSFVKVSYIYCSMYTLVCIL